MGEVVYLTHEPQWHGGDLFLCGKCGRVWPCDDAPEDEDFNEDDA